MGVSSWGPLGLLNGLPGVALRLAGSMAMLLVAFSTLDAAAAEKWIEELDHGVTFYLSTVS